MWSGLERKVSSSRTRWTFLQLLHWQYHHALTSLPGTHCASVLGWDVQALLVGGDRQVNQCAPGKCSSLQQVDPASMAL